MKTWYENSERSEEEVIALERSLRTKANSPSVPDDLHDSIMTGIRNRGAKIERGQSPGSVWWLRWVPAPALVVCVIAGLVYYYRANTPTKPASTAMALATLELGESMAQSLPVAMKPLSEELERVRQDLDRTAKFLAASLP